MIIKNFLHTGFCKINVQSNYMDVQRKKKYNYGCKKPCYRIRPKTKVYYFIFHYHNIHLKYFLNVL